MSEGWHPTHLTGPSWAHCGGGNVSQIDVGWGDTIRLDIAGVGAVPPYNLTMNVLNDWVAHCPIDPERLQSATVNEGFRGESYEFEVRPFNVSDFNSTIEEEFEVELGMPGQAIQFTIRELNTSASTGQQVRTFISPNYTITSREPVMGEEDAGMPSKKLSLATVMIFGMLGLAALSV